MAEMASAEERSAHLHVLIKRLKASGFDEEEISAGITIAKVAALREFVQENEEIVFQGTDDEVMAAAVKKFGTGNGYELTTAASSLVTEVCNEWSIGGKYQMDCTLGAVVGDKKGNSAYKTDWIDSIDMEALRDVVKARAEHDTDWKVFDNAKIFSKDKIYVASLIQQFTDEELVYAEEGTFTPGGEFEDPEYEVHLLEGFGVEVPQPKRHDDLSYGDESEFWDLPPYGGSGDYIAVEKPGQVRHCRKELGVTTLATDNARTARLCFKDIRKYGDWYYCTEVEFKEEESKEDVPVIETVPKALRTVYKALNSDPGRSYYLHGKNRSKFFRYLISNDYLHSAREDNRRYADAAKPRKTERYPPRNQGPRSRDVPPSEKYKSGHRQKAEQRSFDHKRRAQDDNRGRNVDAPSSQCALPDDLQSQLRKVISLKMQPTVLADECQYDEGLLRTLDDRSFVGAGKHTITKEILSKVPLEWIPVEDFFSSAKRVTSGREKCKDQDDLTVLAITRVSSNMDWKETDGGPMVRRK